MRWPRRRLDRIALVVVFLWFAVGGVAHFAFTRAEMRIVPAWVPSAWAAVIVSGVCELLGAVALLSVRTREAAAWGLFVLTLAVTPANVDMLLHAERFPAVPVVLLVLRLPLQVGLLWLIWRVARTGTRDA